MDKVDRRIGKTKQAVYDAFNALLQEKRYSEITIQEIIDRANIGRTTFYSHFQTKDDLLIACIDHIFASLSLTEHRSQNDEGQYFLPVSEIFEHIRENSRVIKGLFISEIDGLLFQKFKDHWNTIIEEYLSRRVMNPQKVRIPVGILTNHITSSLLELAKFWLNTGMTYTPKQMEDYYWALISPCILSAMDR